MVKTRRRSYGPPAPPAAKKKRKADNSLVGIDTLRPIVKILTENDWLDAKNLGILEQTCKNARTTVCTDEVWEALCLRKWPNTKHLKRRLLERTGGYRRWYQLRATAATQPREPLPQPKLKPRVFFFLIDVKAGGRTVMSTVHSGQKHLKLDQDDSFAVKNGCVIHRNALGVSGCQYVLGETESILGASAFISEAFTIDVQLLISDESSRVCQIMKAGQYEARFRKKWMVRAHKNQSEFITPRLTFRPMNNIPRSCKLRSSLMGSAIQQRLGEDFTLKVYPVARFVDDRKKIVVDSIQYEFFVGNSLFNKEIQDQKGVSILHILEELEGQTCER